MSFEIDNIDRISRKIGQDVLLLAFLDEEAESLDLYVDIDPITTWLEAEGIDYTLCTAFIEDVVFIEGGPGCLFLDVWPVKDPVKQKKLERKFGPIGGPGAISGYQLEVLELNDAMKNVKQDDPDFWDSII